METVTIHQKINKCLEVIGIRAINIKMVARIIRPRAGNEIYEDNMKKAHQSCNSDHREASDTPTATEADPRVGYRWLHARAVGPRSGTSTLQLAQFWCSCFGPKARGTAHRKRRCNLRRWPAENGRTFDFDSTIEQRWEQTKAVGANDHGSYKKERLETGCTA